jgi:23S rRNA pseudouridine1911/1915/1917 synthase
MPTPAFCLYHLLAQHTGQTLTAVLRQLRPAESWSQVRRLVHNRHVQVNGNLCLDEGRKLKAGDVIKVWQEPRLPLPRAEELQIRYQDKHLVVVEKPAGVTTLRHAEERNLPRRRRQAQPTLDEMLEQVLARSSKGPGPGTKTRRRPPAIRPVHRLDRDTSGLMVFALSPEAEQRLVQMFRKHDLHRVYLAIALGEVPAQTFESFLVRDRGDGLRGSTRLPGVGQRAVTHVRPLESLDGYTLVECRLETGRTHQIRIHLAEAGHMVCGEKIYNHPFGARPIADRSGAQRQALHAAELGFTHPVTSQPLSFVSPLPPDLDRLLTRLREPPRTP